jgi:hypothetical protein
MPFLSQQIVRTAHVTPEILAIDPATRVSEDLDPTVFAERLGAAWQGWSTAQQTLLLSAATVFGLDGIDGEIDTIPALIGGVRATLTGAGLSPGVASAGSVAIGAVASVVAVGALAALVVNEARRHDSNERAALTATVHAMGDQYLSHYCDGFDEVMGATRDVLQARLQRWLNLDKAFAQEQWLAKTLSDVRSRRNDLLEAIHANPLVAAASA